MLNTDDGVVINNNCSNNGWNGITLGRACINNTVSGNTANENAQYGISLIDCERNSISGNTVSSNQYGIYGWSNQFQFCRRNTISGNTVTNNQYGMYFDAQYYGYYFGENTILGNKVSNNPVCGIYLRRAGHINRIRLNNFTGNGQHAKDDSMAGNNWNNATIGNFWDNYTGVDADDDGIGDTPYTISGSANVQDNYPIWDDGIDVIFLFVEIFDQVFSTEDFNITFYVYNGINESIDFAVIQMWWNGTEVSTSIQNLGGGLYSVSLEPITVEPGEDPILLNMSVFATGYPDKYFEIYIAVDPDVIDKTIPKKKEPIIPGYSIILLIGLISVLSIFIIKKRIKK